MLPYEYKYIRKWNKWSFFCLQSSNKVFCTNHNTNTWLTRRVNIALGPYSLCMGPTSRAATRGNISALSRRNHLLLWLSVTLRHRKAPPVPIIGNMCPGEATTVAASHWMELFNKIFSSCILFFFVPTPTFLLVIFCHKLHWNLIWWKCHITPYF